MTITRWLGLETNKVDQEELEAVILLHLDKLHHSAWEAKYYRNKDKKETLRFFEQMEETMSRVRELLEKA